MALEVAQVAHDWVPPSWAYGHDTVTERAVAAVRRELGEQTEVLFVWDGTAANVVGLRAVVDSYHAVLCGDHSHLWSDECAAPEKCLGCKLQPVRTRNGKIEPAEVRACLYGAGVVHQAQGRVLSGDRSRHRLHRRRARGWSWRIPSRETPSS